MQTTIIIQESEMKKWALMNALDTLGVFDVKFGSVTINFDGVGKVSNVEIKHNYRITELSP